ncbi:hypothetical protein Noda2021_11180 [Candidatus Dependentiae bacterium Noda2021]|nr:hypothetical protein Noda2021_11180 [Candidatus Dependentiae bacterium Noda2021]
MNSLKKTALLTLFLVSSSTTPSQGFFNQKTKKYVKAALYSVAAFGSGYFAYCCLRDLYRTAPADFDSSQANSPHLNTAQVVTNIKKEIDQAKLADENDYNSGLDKGKEVITELVLAITSRERIDITGAIDAIRSKRDTTLSYTQTQNYQSGIYATAKIAIEELQKYNINKQEEPKTSYARKDILGILVASCATIHFGHEAIRYLKSGDSLDVCIKPHVKNGTIQSSMSVGFTMNR